MSDAIEKVFQVQAANSREAIVADGVPRLAQTYVVSEVTVHQYRPRLFNVCVSLSQINKWIAVHHHLPPINRLVLFCCDIAGEFTQVNLGQYSGKWTESKNAVAMQLDGDDWAPCSHWIELPEPPKK